MGRKRTRNYRELREEFDEAERREGEEADDDEDEDEEDEDEEEEEGEEEEEEGEEEEDEDGVPIPKKKKKAKEKVKEKAVPKPRARRSRAKAAVRMKMIWGVFNNSNQRVAAYEYKERQAAVDHAARLTAAKPNNTHFIQPVKEPLEIKAEEK